jgi:hypothetical protein
MYNDADDLGVQQEVLAPSYDINNPIAHVQNQLRMLRSNFLLILSPGNKRFKDLTKRLRMMFVAVLIPLLFAITKMAILNDLTNIIIWLGIGVVFAAITYIGVLWSLKFQIRKESYLSVINIPSLYTLASTIFLSVVFLGPINRVYLLMTFILAIFFFMVSLYIVMLSVNVVNVNLFYVIPLSKLGESILYITSVVITYLTIYSFVTVAIESIRTNLYIPLAFMTVIAAVLLYLLVFATVFYYTPVQGGSILLSAGITVCLLAFTLIFGFFLPYIFLTAFIIALQIYVLLGLLIHKSQNTLKPQIYLEYFVILVIQIGVILWI